MERNRSFNGLKEKTTQQSFLSKHLKKVYPLALRRSNSSQSLPSLSLSQISNDSIGSSESINPRTVDQKVFASLRRLNGTTTPHERAENKLTNLGQQDSRPESNGVNTGIPRVVPKIMMPLHGLGGGPSERRETTLLANVGKDSSDSNGVVTLKRCHWITKNSDQVYVCFHDECWGVPVYNDNQLFELLAMSGMLMDYNWTEILKRKELLREYFAEFNPNVVAKLTEIEIMEISSNKTLMLAESRVRCIIDNAKCILKVADEYGSFSSYIWGYMNYKPMISRFKYPRSIPLRTPKAETISRDLIRRGFRFVGPVIVYSFMQAAGMTIDHLVDCFRFNECVNLAERPWRHG